MATVLDVAQYILEKVGCISTWKLQKLVYYSQAWHLVWTDKPLFQEKIEAWANGPVSPDLYQAHKGNYSVSSINGGKSKNISTSNKKMIDKVVSYYKGYNGQQLSDLTHSELPWKNAREGLSIQERSSKEITKAALAEYYGSL